MLASAELSFPGKQMDAFLLCPKMVKREPFLMGTLILLDQSRTVMTSFNLISIKVRSPNTVTLGAGASTYEFLGDTAVMTHLLSYQMKTLGLYEVK